MEDASGGKHRVLRGCIVAVGATALMLAGRALLDETLGNSSTVAWAVVPIVIAAWYGGIWSGLFAMALGLVLGLHFFMLRGDWRIPDPGDQARIFVFLFAGTMISLLFELLQRARLQLQQRNAQLSAELAEHRRSEGQAREESTRARTAEERLRDSELRYREVAEAASDVIWDWDFRSGRMFFSQRFGALLGCSPEEIGSTARWWLKRLHPEDRQRILHVVRDARTSRADRGRRALEYRIRRADGSYLPVQVRGRVLRDEQGKPVRAVGSLADMTALKNAEATTAHFRALFEASPACNLVLDPDFVIVGASDNLLKATMKTRAEIVGKFLFDVFPDDPDEPRADGTRSWRASLERVRSQLITDVMGLQRYPVERSAEAGGGFEEKYWSALNSPVLDADGKLAFIVHRTEDVTDYVRAHGESAQPALASREQHLEADIFLRAQELVEANRQIKAQNDRLRFLAGIDDEARTRDDPAAIVAATAERLRRHLGADRCTWVEVADDNDSFVITGDFASGMNLTDKRSRMSTLGEECARILRRGAPLVMEDVERAGLPPEAVASWRAWELRATLTIPQLRDDRVRSLFAMHHASPRHWTAEEIELAQTVSQRLWESLERMRAGRKLSMTAEKLGDVNQRLAFAMELDDAALAQSDPEIMMVTVAEQVCRRLGAQRCSWFDVEEDGDHYYVHGDFNDGVPSRKGRHRLSTYGPRLPQLLAIGTPFICDDTQSPAAEGLDTQAFRVADVGAMIVVPLLRNGRLIAGVALHSRTARVWTQAEIDTMELLAHRSWETLERARITRALQESNARLQFTVDLGQALEPLSDPSAMMNIAMRHLAEAISVQRCAWAEFEEDEDHYSVIGNYLIGMPDRVGRYRWSAFGEEALRRLRSDHTTYSNDVETDPMSGADLSPYRAGHIRAYMVKPVRKNGRLVAALAVNCAAPRQWRTSEIELLELTTQRCWESMERVRNLRQLHASREELREADRIKDQFLATLAHELRGPLAPMSNALQLLRTTADEHGRDRARQVMKRQLAHLVRLVDDLLDVGRIRSGKLELQLQWLALDEVVRNALEIADPLIRASKHRIQVQLPPQIVRVLADPARLAQALANLLNNSAKYTPPGGHIGLTVNLEDGQLSVAVKDDGVGISAEALPRVFDLFAQIDTSRGRAQGGLGVGLSLVKKMLEMHGGTVVASSEGSGRGSSFTLHLPADKVSYDMPPAPAGSVSKVEKGQHPLRPAGPVSRRIVVADDNADSAETTAALLALLGHEVKTASDGAMAVQLAERMRPDVMVMDIGMPNMNGLEAAQEIRKRPWGRKMILIALSGWGQEEDRRRSTEAGFDFHLVKPVELESLEKMLEAAPAAAKPEPAALAG